MKNFRKHVAILVFSDKFIKSQIMLNYCRNVGGWVFFNLTLFLQKYIQDWIKKKLKNFYSFLCCAIKCEHCCLLFAAWRDGGRHGREAVEGQNATDDAHCTAPATYTTFSKSTRGSFIDMSSHWSHWSGRSHARLENMWSCTPVFKGEMEM